DIARHPDDALDEVAPLVRRILEHDDVALPWRPRTIRRLVDHDVVADNQSRMHRARWDRERLGVEWPVVGGQWPNHDEITDEQCRPSKDHDLPRWPRSDDPRGVNRCTNASEDADHATTQENQEPQRRWCCEEKHEPQDRDAGRPGDSSAKRAEEEV